MTLGGGSISHGGDGGSGGCAAAVPLALKLAEVRPGKIMQCGLSDNEVSVVKMMMSRLSHDSNCHASAMILLMLAG